MLVILKFVIEIQFCLYVSKGILSNKVLEFFIMLRAVSVAFKVEIGVKDDLYKGQFCLKI